MNVPNRLSGLRAGALAVALSTLAASGCAQTSAGPAPEVGAQGAIAPAAPPPATAAPAPALPPAPVAAPPPASPAPLPAAAPAQGAKADLPPVAPATAQRHPGKIVWYDLLTLDSAAAQRFYGGVMGWTFVPQGGSYTLVQQRGVSFAGIVKMPPPEGQAPQARWVPLVSVANLETAVAVVAKQGGKVVEGPGSLGARGRYAAIADARGAQLVLLDSAGGDPPDATSVPGWIWAELWTDDPPAAAAFYESVVGYRVQQEGSGKSAVWTFSSEDRPRTRAARMPFEKVTAQWIPYAGVPDLKSALARVRELGGRVIQAPSKSVGQGTLAVVADPGGAVLVLQQRSDAEAVAAAVGAIAGAAGSDPYGIEAAQKQAEEEAAAQAAGADASVAVVVPVPEVPYVGFWFGPPSPWWGWWGPSWWGPGWVGAPPGWMGGPGWWRPPPPGYYPPGRYPPGPYAPGYRPAPPRTPGYRPAPPATRPPAGAGVRAPGASSAPAYRPGAPAPRSSAPAPSSRPSAPPASSRGSAPTPAPRR
jgi:hypothetical protein